MVKKLLIVAIVIALVVTGGIFASTHTTATATIGVTSIDSDFAMVIAENITSLAPAIFGDYTGSWPTGTLFTVTPDASYTGDLSISAYLVNTGKLSKYYEHLNMALEFKDSTDTTADVQGTIQALTLQNGEVLFDWESGTGTAPYYVQLTGGGYKLHPWKTMSGGSVQPQLWLEIVQR